MQRSKVDAAQLALLPIVSSEGIGSLSDAMQQILEFRDARDWKQFHRPKELAAALAIEAAEVQELFLWRDAESSVEILRGSKERIKRIHEELADVAIFLLLLAHELDVNLLDVVMMKLELNKERFPVQTTRGVAGKHH